ncbi:MAG: long-chain fatty acid--CoA ligase [Cyclobacteriaceae bacterium]|nr:long-chain fatty acid--CoA ligase [Cyclobacteriaceae bacterium]
MAENIVAGIINNIGTHGDEEAVRFKHNHSTEWHSYSWAEFSNLVKLASKALLALDVKHQENIAIFSQNKVEWSIADLGIMGLGAVCVPIYATNTSEQARYILDEAQIRFVFVGDQEQYDKALELYADSASTIEKIIVFEKSVTIKNEASIYFYDFLNLGKNIEDGTLEVRSGTVMPGDLATIIYTSGTTGEPKGVMLTHENFDEIFKIHDMRLHVSRQDHSLSFLPLSHVFERCWSLYVFHKGIKNTYLNDPKKILETLGEEQPTLMCSVPRLYQKAYHTILAKAEVGSAIKRALFRKAIQTGRQRANLMREGRPVPATLTWKYGFFDALIFKKIRKAFGGKLRMMPCAGAPLSAEITEFFHAVGMPLLIGYGLTETTATVTVFPETGFKFGTVGVPMPGLDVRIGEDDEILVKGKTIMKGYYKKPQETAKVFQDGWFKTGDAGTIDEDGHLTITDRIKDLMKTSGGKYVAPQQIESILTNDNFIENAILIGDDKPYISALLVPNIEALKEYALSLNIKYQNIEDLLKKSHIREFYEQKLEQLQSSLASFEKVKKFRLLSHDFSMHLGELTPTLKIRRQTIIKHFKSLIDEMYTFRPGQNKSGV